MDSSYSDYTDTETSNIAYTYSGGGITTVILTVVAIIYGVEILLVAIIYGFIVCCCPTALKKKRPGLILGEARDVRLPVASPVNLQNIPRREHIPMAPKSSQYTVVPTEQPPQWSMPQSTTTGTHPGGQQPEYNPELFECNIQGTQQPQWSTSGATN